MAFEIPNVDYYKQTDDYTLKIRLPEEYEQWKEVLPEMGHEGLEIMAKSIFETYELPITGFPKITWNEKGELKHILIGSNCACISLKDNRTYISHNLRHPHQVFAALNIISLFYQWVTQAIEKKTKD